VKIKTSSQIVTKDLKKYVDQVTEAFGRPEALVTDESIVADLLEIGGTDYQSRRGNTETWTQHAGKPEVAKANAEALRQASEKLSIPIEPSDLIIAVAHRLRNLARS
jgi:hypothetical protein